jgi:hypothetical protein
MTAAASEHAEPQHGLRIFLCYSSGDKPAVRELYRRLRADGFEPWLDGVNLLPGQTGGKKSLGLFISLTQFWSACRARPSGRKAICRRKSGMPSTSPTKSRKEPLS